VRFTVFGDAKSAGSKRAYRHPSTGKVVVTETVRGSKSWQGSVAAAGAEAHRGSLLDGPLRVAFIFYRPRPKSHHGTGRNADKVKSSAPPFPATRPDVLKLARGVEDALTGIVWRDDAQIVTEELRKRWGSPARVEIEVEELDHESRAPDALAPDAPRVLDRHARRQSSPTPRT
jgi:Holliday junction resolvase RusA-like endonuclease